MQSPLALFDLSGVFDLRSALIPVAGAVIAGLSFLIFRGGLSNLRLFGTSESDSIMNFSSLGTLRCVCGAEHREGLVPNRRRFCRSCGCEAVKQDSAMLEKQLTSREIEHLTRSLRRAARRSRGLDVPPSITTVEDLHRYLDADYEMPRQKMPPPPSFEHPQVH